MHDVKKAHPSRPIIYIYGASSYKSVKPILDLLGETCQKVFLVEGQHFRAMKIDALQQQI
jgi:folylpolyglutamate synthase/dihydropteroate synthase